MPSSTSIFGVDPAMEDIIEEVNSAFESWKGWRRASSRFFEDLPSNNDGESSEISLVNGPYFQRSAMIWTQIIRWCNAKTEVGRNILGSLRRGLRYKDWDASYRSKTGLRAAQAFYAFCGGQSVSLYPNGFDGLFGGYQAYNYYCNSHLVPPGKVLNDNIHLAVSQCNFSNLNRLPKLFAVNLNTGDLALLTPSQRLTRAVSVKANPTGDEFLIWLEEFARRLSSGLIGEGIMGSTPHDPVALTLFPRWRRGIASPVTPQGIPECSYAVTRGVEVIASAVYAPQALHQFGFIYSIRVRLVAPNSGTVGRDDDGDDSKYQSPDERGFVTCQLRSRHWKISNYETGNEEDVHGEGVIGMYPLLREGGYTDAGYIFEGGFRYQSCTGPMRKGAFEGTLEFIPGSLNAPTGPPFHVELKPFLLTNEPSIIY
jgi:uncharacterized protein affecting Mg2+/Co2+ transport